MKQSFAQKLAVGGKANSLGLAEEVVQDVIADKNRLDELYACLFEEDACVRMRAADALEKVCRVHPEWLMLYADRIIHEMGKSTQPSLQWHVAQMLNELPLNESQQRDAVVWLTERLEEKEGDWIVVANSMSTMAAYAKKGIVPLKKAIALIEGQQEHRSQSVRRRAAKLLAELESV